VAAAGKISEPSGGARSASGDHGRAAIDDASSAATARCDAERERGGG
jgi:hypothetical protein